MCVWTIIIKTINYIKYRRTGGGSKLDESNVINSVELVNSHKLDEGTMYDEHSMDMHNAY